MWRCFVFVLIIVSFVSCNSTSDRQVTRAFYFWQSNLNLTKKEIQTIQETGVTVLYVKYFDVVWDESANQPKPVAQVSIQNLPKNLSVYPVVFITNETLLHLNNGELTELSVRINKLIERLHAMVSAAAPAHIQIDCDWTESSRAAYFWLLTQLQQYPPFRNTTWSATIRLHQWVYSEQTGVPPVQKGLLMFYNMGNIDQADTINSIYHNGIAQQYLEQTKPYPLPLDAGIAAYSWALYYHNQELQRIFYPFNPAEADTSLFFWKESSGRYVVTREGWFKGHYLKKNDQLHLESCTPATSLQAARQLSEYVHNDSIAVVLYHLDSLFTQHYQPHDIQAIFSAFQ